MPCSGTHEARLKLNLTTGINPVYMKTHLLSFAYSSPAIPEEIIQCFSPVRLYLPWGANLPDYNNDGDIIVSYPPEGLMPGVDIDKLLDEHLSLALELAEKSRYEIIKRGASANLSDESIKGIRAALMGRSSTGTPERDQIIRWHMLLLLADRFAKETNEAERMIDSLRKRKSPLFNSAELDDNNIYPLETLAGMNSEPGINEKILRQLLKAWQALFGGYTNEGDLFLVINPSVFAYLNDEYKELCINKGLQMPADITCKIPLAGVQKDKPDGLNEIMAIFSSLKSGDTPLCLADSLRAFEAQHGIAIGMPSIHISVLLMERDLVKNDPLLKMLSGSIIVLAELIK